MQPLVKTKETLYGVKLNGQIVCQLSYNPNDFEERRKAKRFKIACVRAGLLVVDLKRLIKETLDEMWKKGISVK